MNKTKYIEEKTYNSSDLSFGSYSYRYFASFDEKDFDIVGFRRGILYNTGNGYIDLITNFIVNDSDILFNKEFKVKDVQLTRSQITTIFKAVEEDGFVATEHILNIEKNNLPPKIDFKASNAIYGYKSYFPYLCIESDNISKKSFTKIIGSLFRK